MNGQMEPLKRRKWGPEQHRMRADYIKQFMAQGVTETRAAKHCDSVVSPSNVWENDEYSVIVHAAEEGVDIFAGWVIQQLSIQRRDRAAVQDWRDLQAIKNQLVGPDCEAFELYPAENRVVDTQNQFHLFAVLGAGGRTHPLLPVGWAFGCRYTPEEAKAEKFWVEQRAFAAGVSAK